MKKTKTLELLNDYTRLAKEFPGGTNNKELTCQFRK